MEGGWYCTSACDDNEDTDNEFDKIASTSRVGLSEATSFLECSQEGKYSGHKIVSWLRVLHQYQECLPRVKQ